MSDVNVTDSGKRLLTTLEMCLIVHETSAKYAHKLRAIRAITRLMEAEIGDEPGKRSLTSLEVSLLLHYLTPRRRFITRKRLWQAVNTRLDALGNEEVDVDR